MIRSRSRHSRRTLPTQRSAWARAFGARIGALITRMPSEREDLVVVAGELAVAVTERETADDRYRRRRVASAGCAPAGPPTKTRPHSPLDDSHGSFIRQRGRRGPVRRERSGSEKLAQHRRVCGWLRDLGVVGLAEDAPWHLRRRRAARILLNIAYTVSPPWAASSRSRAAHARSSSAE